MKLNKGFPLLATKLVVILSLFLISAAYFTPTTYAVEASKSSNFIQQKIDELKAEIASKAAKIKEQITRKLQNKILTGTIASISDNQITILSDYPHSERQIITNEYTTFVKKGTKNTDITDIKPGDYVASLGDIDDKNNMIAKKVVVTSPPETTKTILTGEIQEVATNSVKIKRDTTELILNFDKKSFFDSQNGTLTIKSLQIGNIVAAVSIKQDQSNYLRYLYLLNNRVSTPSATPTNSTTSATEK